MDPDDAADLLGELPAEEAERLLTLMEPEEAAPVRRLLSYREDTAGGLMTTDPIILPPYATVAEALAQVRNPDLTPAIAAPGVRGPPPTETPTGRYLGTVHFQRLLREPPTTLVSAAVDSDLEPLRAGPAAAEVTALHGHLQPGRRAGGGRGRPAARRGHRGRRAGPPAAGRLADAGHPPPARRLGAGDAGRHGTVGDRAVRPRKGRRAEMSREYAPAPGWTSRRSAASR